MKVQVTLEVDHKDLDKLQSAIDHTSAFTRYVVGSETAPAEKAKTKTKAKTEKAEPEPAREKPAVEKPTTSPDEVRAAMLAYSKVHGTESTIKILKDVGKAEKVKDVEPSEYAALIRAFDDVAIVF